MQQPQQGGAVMQTDVLRCCYHVDYQSQHACGSPWEMRMLCMDCCHQQWLVFVADGAADVGAVGAAEHPITILSSQTVWLSK